jgi:cell division protein FtsL
VSRWIALFGGLAVLALAIGLYWAKTETARKRADVAALERVVAQERAAVRARRAEIAHLESPARIDALAAEKLELEPGAESRARDESAIDSALPAPERR